MVKNPPSNAGNVDLIPGLGTKIPQTWGNYAHTWQLEKLTHHSNDTVQSEKKKEDKKKL